MDFKPTCFSHPKAADGFTLSHPKKAIRDFWIDQCIRSREIGAVIGKALGSHEFYMGYAIKNQKLLCLDAGHFHPTVGIADKISSVLMYVPEILLHVSRGVPWDSDHVVILDDALQSIATELVRNKLVTRTHIGLDFFDASINRIAAWAIGTRNTLRALLIALLEPAALRESDKSGDLTSRLALMEEAKCLPWGAVWDAYYESQNVPAGNEWLGEVKKYESEVLSKR